MRSHARAIVPSSWDEAADLMASKGERWSGRIAHNTYLLLRVADFTHRMSYAVRYHRTDVVEFHSDGSVTLRNGGWDTRTTYLRFTLAGIRTYSHRRVRYVIHHGRELEFEDGMRLHADGSVTYRYGSHRLDVSRAA